MLGDDILHQDLAAGGSHGGHIGACLNLVGNDGVAAAPQAVHALNFNGVRAGTPDVGAHRVEEVGQVHDMRLLGSVLDDGVAFRPDGGHHDIHGSAHGDHIQIDVGALEAAGLRGSVDEAALHHDLGAKRGKALHVLVDGAHPEVAAAGHGDLRLAEAAQERTNQIIGGPHLPGQLIGGSGGADAAGVDLHCMAVDDADAGTQMLQNLQGQRHIGDLGDIFDPADPVHQQSGGNDGNGGVFGAADLYFTKQGMTTLYNILCQSRYPLFKRRFLLWRHL